MKRIGSKSVWRKSAWLAPLRRPLIPILTGVLACTWVPLDDKAAAVTVAESTSVEACDRLGTTTSTVRARIGFVDRSEIKVKRELATLARNEAIRMEGDTISPESPVKDGRRIFGVYRCRS